MEDGRSYIFTIKTPARPAPCHQVSNSVTPARFISSGVMTNDFPEKSDPPSGTDDIESRFVSVRISQNLRTTAGWPGFDRIIFGCDVAKRFTSADVDQQSRFRVLSLLTDGRHV